jgi:glutamate 5-kinase
VSQRGAVTCRGVPRQGYDLANIKKVFGGEDVGTLFPGRSRPNKRQRWLTLATGSAGSITVSPSFHEKMLGGQDLSLRLTDVLAVQGGLPRPRTRARFIHGMLACAGFGTGVRCMA